MDRLAEPGRGDPAWVGERLREGKLVWRLVVDETVVKWHALATCRTVARLLAERDDPCGRVRNLARSALASARHGDHLAVRDAEDAIVAHRQDVERNAARERPFCDPVSFAVTDGDADRALVWRKCTTLAQIRALGMQLDNCLSGAGWGARETLRQDAFAGRTEIWALDEAGQAVVAAQIDTHGVHRIQQVRGRGNRDPDHRYRHAIALLWLWHRAHDPSPHVADWESDELDPPFVRPWRGGTPLEQALEEDFHDLVPVIDPDAFPERAAGPRSRLPRTTPTLLPALPSVRAFLRSIVDPARDWSLEPPRLGGPRPAAMGRDDAANDLAASPSAAEPGPRRAA